MIGWIIGATGIGKWLAGAVVAILGALGLYAKGRGDAKRATETKQLKANEAANDRINKVPDTGDLSDDQRVRELTDVAKRLGG